MGDFKKIGIPVWQPYLDEQTFQKKQFGRFRVQTFDLPHHGTDNRGFLIKVDGEKILYMTDFEFCIFKFDNFKVNHILIECNYQQKYVDRDLPNFEHKIRGHCSIDNCKEFIRVNATDALQTVLLLHMGKETCNPNECVTDVQKVAKNAYVDYARTGLEVELRNSGMCPF